MRVNQEAKGFPVPQRSSLDQVCLVVFHGFTEIVAPFAIRYPSRRTMPAQHCDLHSVEHKQPVLLRASGASLQTPTACMFPYLVGFAARICVASGA